MIWSALALLAVGAVADLLATDYAIRAGGSEGNPLMRERGTRVVLKCAVAFIVAFCSVRLGGDRGALLALAGACVWLGAAAWNVVLARKLRG